jgi:hypothetical protein
VPDFLVPDFFDAFLAPSYVNSARLPPATTLASASGSWPSR